MTAIQTAIFYLAMILATSLLAHRCDITGKKAGLVVATVLLIIVAGFRGYDVGQDTFGYKEGIEYFFVYGTQAWNHAFSDGYGWFTCAVLTVCNNYTFLLVVEAIITCGLFAARLWDFREGCSLGFAMFVYATVEYPLSLCLTCQCLSVAIVFFGSRYLDRGRPLVFVVLMVVASFIHVSALVGLAYLAIYVFKLRSRTKVLFYAKMVASAIILVGGALAAMMLINRYGGYYANKSSIGLMVVVQAIVLAGSLLLAGYFSKKSKREAMSEATFLALPLCVLGVALSASSYVIANAGRIAYYFTIYAPIVFGHLVKDSGKNKSAFVLGFLLVIWLLFYAWYAYLFSTGLGIEAYSFVWMQ